MSTTPTPRTDAKANNASLCDQCVPADFARQLETGLAESEAACAAMRALLTSISHVISSDEIMHCLRSGETINRVFKGQAEADGKGFKMSGMQSGASKGVEQDGTPETRDADCPESISGKTHRKGKGTLAEKKGVESKESDQRSSASETSERDCCRENQKAGKLPRLRSETETSWSSRGLFTSALRDLGVREMSWTEAQKTIAGLISATLTPKAVAYMLAELERLRHQMKKPRVCDTDEIRRLEVERDNLSARLSAERTLADQLAYALARFCAKEYLQSEPVTDVMAAHAEARKEKA